MKTNGANWKKIFNTDDTAWLARLDNEQAESVRDVLESIVEKISYCDIDVLRDLTYTKYMGELIKIDEGESKEMMLLDTVDMFRIREGGGYLYCDISVYDIDNLIFEKLGAKNGFVFYEILLKEGTEYTKMEMAVVDDTA